jgi:hypothetical protein
VKPLALVAVVALVLPPAAQAQPAADQWTFALTPYVWLPNVDGTLKYSAPPGATGAPEVRVGPNDYLENLDFALMLAGEARKGRWSIVTDLVYLDFAAEGGSVNAVDFGGSRVSTNLNTNTKSSLKGLQWTLAGGYTVMQTPSLTLDVLGGFRYLGLEARTDWQLAAAVTGPGAGQTFPASGSATRQVDLWDAIVGIRGRVRLGESRWFMPFHLDAGAGSSSRTWQGQLGIAYAFKWGDAVLAYRHLAYDQDDNKLLQDFRFSGPALGASFRF